MDANDDFQDAVDEPQYEQQEDGSYIFTDKDGYKVQMPKEWHLFNSFTFADEDLKQVVENVHPGNCAITDEMRKAGPQEPIIQFGKAKPFRIFFHPPEEPGPWSYTEEEKEFLKQFKEYCKSNGYNVPHNDGEIMRWAYANKMQHPKTYNALVGKKKLLDESFPYHITKRAFDLLDNGFMYVCGRDRLYRPIIVIRYHVLQDKKPLPQPEDVIGAALLNVMFVEKFMMENGVVENLIQVGDNSGTSILTMPYKLVRGVLGYMTQINRGRARTVFGLSAPSTISVIWNAVRYFLDENTQQKVVFTTASTNPMLLQMVHPSQLEEKYGGTAKNRVQGEYWPPRLNSDTFGFGELTDVSAHKQLTDDEMLKMSVLTQNEGQMTEEQIAKQFEEMQAKMQAEGKE